MDETSIIQSNGTERKLRRNFENFVVLLVGVSIEETKMKEFQSVANNVYSYSNADDCLQSLTTINDAKVFLVISDVLIEKMLPKLHSFVAVIASIFIYGNDTKKEEDWRRSFHQVKGVFADMKPMLNRMRRDTFQVQNDMVKFTFIQEDKSFTSSPQTNKQDVKFMHSQLLKEIILKLTDTDIKDLADYCRLAYADNTMQLRQIDNFEHSYHANDAVRWYSGDTFVYRMLNKALRTLDVDTIYAFRVFIKHLHQQLFDVALENNYRTPHVLYRGLCMPNDVFAQFKSNVGGLLSIPNFLSTSESEDVARIFASSGEESTAVLMIIKMDSSIRSEVFIGNLDRLSQFGEAEHEYLFSMGSVFRIVSVQQKENDLWEVVLKLTTDNDPQMMKLSDFVKKQIKSSDNPLVVLGHLTRRIEHSYGEKFYIKALESEMGWKERTEILDILGNYYRDIDQYDKALENYKQAFDLKRQNEPENKLLISQSYYYLGCIHYAKENLSTAVDCFQCSLDIETSNFESMQETITERSYQMALAFYFQNKYEEALICFNRVLTIRLTIYPKGHNDISAAYYIIGHTLHKLGRIQEANEFAEKAVANYFFTAHRGYEKNYQKELEKVCKQLESQVIWTYIGTLNLYDAGDGSFLTWAD